MSKINIAKTTLYNSHKITAIIIATVALVCSALFVDKSTISSDPFGYTTFILVGGFMFLWSFGDWNMTYLEE